MFSYLFEGKLATIQPMPPRPQTRVLTKPVSTVLPPATTGKDCTMGKTEDLYEILLIFRCTLQ